MTQVPFLGFPSPPAGGEGSDFSQQSFLFVPHKKGFSLQSVTHVSDEFKPSNSQKSGKFMSYKAGDFSIFVASFKILWNQIKYVRHF